MKKPKGEENRREITTDQDDSVKMLNGQGSYHHIHKGGGSFKSMANPRRTIPKNDVGVGVSGGGTATETELSALAEGPLSQLMSLRTPVWRNSPSTRRPEGELQRSEGALRSSDRAVAGAGKLVLALAPLRDLAAPS